MRGRISRQWRRTRIGDLERDRALETLTRHYEEGRLSFNEFDERTDAAATARTNGELDRVLRELPALPEPVQLARPIRTYLIVNAFLVLLWYLTRNPHSGSGQAEFWPLWPIVIWGFLLAVRARRAPHRRRALTRGRYY